MDVCEGLKRFVPFQAVPCCVTQWCSELSGDKKGKKRDTSNPSLSVWGLFPRRHMAELSGRRQSMLGLWALLPGGCGDTFSFLRISSILDKSWKTEILLQLIECDWHIWKCVSTKPGTRGSVKNAALRERKETMGIPVRHFSRAEMAQFPGMSTRWQHDFS